MTLDLDYRTIKANRSLPRRETACSPYHHSKCAGVASIMKGILALPIQLVGKLLEPVGRVGGAQLRGPAIPVACLRRVAR